MSANSCAECHTVFAVDEMIRHGNIFICANCKPRFMQKLSEGAMIPGAVHYAGFWRRFLAVFVDGLILGIANFLIQVVILIPTMSTVSPGEAGVTAVRIVVILAVYGFQIGTYFAYETVLIWKYGATPGKMACGMAVVTAEGKPLSYGLSAGRFFAKLLSGLTCYIGYIIAAFDEEKRSLHDRICNTRVVMK